MASNNNICVFTYAYIRHRTTLFNLLAHLNKMVKTKRIEFVAKQARDLVLRVRNECYETGKSSCINYLSQVDVVGFSFGAHIGSHTCKFLFEKTGQKVRMLLGT